MQSEQYNFSQLISHVEATIACVERLIKEPGPCELQLRDFLHEMGTVGIHFSGPRRKPVRNSRRDADLLPTPPRSPLLSGASAAPEDAKEMQMSEPDAHAASGGSLASSSSFESASSSDLGSSSADAKEAAEDRACGMSNSFCLSPHAEIY